MAGWVLCNRGPLEAKIREKLPDYEVEHGCGFPFMVWSEVDGKPSEKECVPGYYFLPPPLSTTVCAKSLDKTAALAAAAAGGAAPAAETMER